MSKTLELVCVITEADLRRFFATRTRVQRWLAATIGVFVPVCTAYLFIHFPRHRTLDETLLLIGPALILGLLAVHFSSVQAWVSARDTIEKNPGLRESRYLLSDEGVRTSNSESHSQISWSAINKATEDDGMFLIYLRNGAAFILPKSNFTNDQIQDLRKLLRETLLERARLLS